MGHVEYKLIYETSLLSYDSQVDFTCNYCRVASKTGSMTFLRASVVLKNLSLPFVQTSST